MSVEQPNSTQQSVRLAVRGITYMLLSPLALFISAGRLRWPAGWAYLALPSVGVFISRLFMDPSLRRERMQPGAGAKDWDKVLAPAVAVVGPTLVSVAAGLDARAGSGNPRPLPQVAGLAMATFGSAFAGWAMVANKYFASLVRIQSDRGQKPVEQGPYAYVRHPGYAGAVAFTLAAPLALGSRRAVAPALLLAALNVLRTALEDRALRQELPGYEDYAQRVRYRLLPGVW